MIMQQTPAPLLLTDAAKPPPGGEAAFVTATDGRRLRLGFWPGDVTRPPVMVLPGRTEYIEKYYPIIARLQARGLRVGIIDFRGQGLSDRLLPDPRKGHVDDFADYQQDVMALQTAMAARWPRHGAPVILAHSMGGCIAVRALVNGLPARAVMLSAPMLGLSLSWLLTKLAPPLARWGVALGMASSYAPGFDKRTLVDYGFAGNKLTRDAKSFAVLEGLLRTHGALSLGGVTFGWLSAAFAEMRALRDLRFRAPPVTVAISPTDPVVSFEAACKFVARTEGAELVTLGGALHEPLQETPEIVATFWIAFDELLERAGI